MKKPWLILAAVLFFVAIATSIRQNNTRKKPRQKKQCIGCYTLMSLPLGPEIRIDRDENSTSPPVVEPGKLNSTRKKPRPRLNKYCIGCYTPLAEPGQLEGKINWDENSTSSPVVEPGKLPPVPGIRLSRVEDSIPSILEPRKLALRPRSRTKREGKKNAVLAQRRAKQRAGARPVCRGCYSGLMIVAPTVQGGKSESLKESGSESDGDSSGEN